MSKRAASAPPQANESQRLIVAASDGASPRQLLAGRSLDSPRAGYIVEDEILVTGWVLGASERCLRVIATADGRRLGHVRADRLRPDIKEVFPDLPHADQSGFRIRIPAQLLRDVAELELSAELQSGTRSKFWTIRLEQQPTAATTQPTAGGSGILQHLSRRLRPGAGADRVDSTADAAQAHQPVRLLPRRTSDFRVVALISAFNEADVLGSVLGHLAANDVETYVIDDGSTDGTAEVAREWLGRGLIGIERLEKPAGAKTSWQEILRRKQALADELGADWYIHHDADEIRESPWPGGSLRDGVQWVDQLGYNAIDFRVLQFWPVDDAFTPGDDPRDHFRRWTDPAEYDVVQRKAWRAGYANTVLADGGHDVQFAERRLFPIRFLVRHYPIRGQTHGLRKVLRERKERFSEEEIAYGWHRQYDDVLTPDHMFLRNPASLREFDLEAIRLDGLLDADRKGAADGDAGDPDAPEKPPVRGFLEQVTSTMISGWAGREDATGEPVSVDLWDGAVRIATLRAEEPRADIREKGIDGGGFRFKTPGVLLDGRPHWIWATASDTDEALRGAPTVLHAGGRLAIGSDIGMTAD